MFDVVVFCFDHINMDSMKKFKLIIHDTERLID
jgi:hypothetical protein